MGDPFRRSGLAWRLAGGLGAALLLAGGTGALADDLAVLAAGATESTVRDVVGTFEKESGHTVALSFGAVGALRDRVQAGERADAVVVTPVIVDQLAARGLVRAGSRIDLGQVGGGIAVRAGAPRPSVGTPGDLRRALLQAAEVYYADPATATAGAYFLEVADRLGVGDEVRRKGHVAPGGREAMEAMALSKADAIGLTQVSEILSVPQVVLIGPYPGDLQSSTTYSGILPAGTRHPEAATAFLRFLAGPLARARFARAGFEVPPVPSAAALPGAPGAAIPLPAPRRAGSLSVEAALAARRSVRAYAPRALTIGEVGQLLWAAQGVSSPEGKRTAPSARRRYPLEIALVAQDVDGLARGAYRYLPATHALAPLVAGRGLLARATSQAPVQAAPAVVVVAAAYGRMGSGPRDRTFTDFEAGLASQNLMLQAVALGLGAVVIGGIDAAAAHEALRLAPEEEVVVLIPVGGPARGASGGER
jgi:molybdate transport system substrate-binding protein